MKLIEKPKPKLILKNINNNKLPPLKKKYTKIVSNEVVDFLNNIQSNNIIQNKKPKKQIFLDDTKICRVCYDEFENNIEKEPLKCGHIFHYECIILAFQSSNNKKSCPYCSKHHGYLRLKNNLEPIKNIHREYNKPTENIQSQLICQATTKSGKPCKIKAKSPYLYCSKHTPQLF